MFSQMDWRGRMEEEREAQGWSTDNRVKFPHGWLTPAALMDGIRVRIDCQNDLDVSRSVSDPACLSVGLCVFLCLSFCCFVFPSVPVLLLHCVSFFVLLLLCVYFCLCISVALCICFVCLSFCCFMYLSLSFCRLLYLSLYVLLLRCVSLLLSDRYLKCPVCYFVFILLSLSMSLCLCVFLCVCISLSLSLSGSFSLSLCCSSVWCLCLCLSLCLFKSIFVTVSFLLINNTTTNF